MDIDNSFRVEVPVDAAWAVLLDLERIAPCVPGAQLRAVEGGELHGIVEVTAGPATAHYQGTAKLERADESTHTAVIVASGSDTDGHSDAVATIQLSFAPDGDGTRVDVAAEVAFTGTVGQFGHDELGERFGNALARFVENLERDVLPPDVVDLTTVDQPAGGVAAPTDDGGDGESDEIVAEAVARRAEPAAEPSGNGAAARRADQVERASVEVLEVERPPVLRRLAPVAGLIAAVLALRWLLRHRRS